MMGAKSGQGSHACHTCGVGVKVHVKAWGTCGAVYSRCRTASSSLCLLMAKMIML